MLKNYLTIALRSALRHKSYTLINTVGLGAGTGVSILMLLFAYNILTFDAFHSRSDDLYFLYRTRATPEGPVPVDDTWYPLLDEARRMYPAIEDGVRFLDFGRSVEYEGRRTLETVFFTDPSLFTVFDGFKLLRGDEKTVLAQPNSIVMTPAKARALVGNVDPIGQTLTLNNAESFTITGIMEEVPANSSMDIDIVAPLQSLPFVHETGWDQSYLTTFVQLKPGADPARLEAQFPAFVEQFFAESERGDVKLMPLRDFNDYQTGRRSYAVVLLLIGFGILLIACINFTNLSTARSMLRAREIGMRKVLGATRPRLIAQFLSDAMLMSLAGLAAGCILAQLLLPAFNEFVEMELSLGLLQNPERLFALLGIGLVTGLLAGCYPALYLSRLAPLRTIKHQKTAGGGAFGMRNVLVAVQFSLAILLLAGVAVMVLQISYLKDRDLQFAQEDVLVIPFSSGDFADAESAAARIESFKEEIASLASVQSVAASSSVPSRYGGNFTLLKPEDQLDRDPLDWRFAEVDADYFGTYGIEFLEGRNFSKDLGEDVDRGIIINESALRAIGWTTGVGRQLIFPSSGNGWTIVGVVRDFHYQAVSTPIEPVVHVYRGSQHPAYRFVTARLQPGSSAAVLASIESLWQRLDAAGELSYFFVDDVFDELYQSQENTATIVSYAALIALLIACMGLLGLAAFTVVQRMREIAVRKVLGARESSVVALFARQFAAPVVLAAVAALPLAYYLMTLWLADFPYRIDLARHIPLFVAAGILVVAAAILTVGVQTWRFARMDPAVVLRTE